MADSLLEALFDAQGEFPAIRKASENDFFNSKFASFRDIKLTIDPILRAHGLGISQPPTNLDGKPALKTKLFHVPTGEFIEDVVPLVLAKTDPQAFGSALSYTKRYAYEAILGLITVDDDGEAATHANPKELEAAFDRATAAAQKVGVPNGEMAQMFFKKYKVKLSDTQDVAAVNALAEHLESQA